MHIPGTLTRILEPNSGASERWVSACTWKWNPSFSYAWQRSRRDEAANMIVEASCMPSVLVESPTPHALISFSGSVFGRGEQVVVVQVVAKSNC